VAAIVAETAELAEHSAGALPARGLPGPAVAPSAVEHVDAPIDRIDELLGGQAQTHTPPPASPAGGPATPQPAAEPAARVLEFDLDGALEALSDEEPEADNKPSD
jgi:hypothetical protein